MQNKLIIIGMMLAVFGAMWFLTWAFAVQFDEDEILQIFWFFLSLIGIGGGVMAAQSLQGPK